MIDEVQIAVRWELVGDALSERQRRLLAAAEARSQGAGGVSATARATGLSRRTIQRGLRDLDEGADPGPGRVRRAGAGRKPLTETDPELLGDLDKLLEPAVRGDPERPLRWTSKSAAKLALGLQQQGHQIVARTVLRLLGSIGFTMQANRKTREGDDHPDRDAQFEHINDTAAAALEARQPVISVDTKKKELVGDFKAVGREWTPTGKAVQVNTHDFPSHAKGKAIPYGIFDLARNEGWVSVGISFDTAQFAAAAIRGWWQQLGKASYPDAEILTITADSGGSNSSRGRLWKIELQKLADEIAMPIRVLHFPPGTSKWNRIEHRLFSFITINWRGRPLTDYATIINLIAATSTDTGLKVYAQLDETAYEKGIKITAAQMKSINIQRDSFHGDWNYTIHPTATVITS
ncbi:MAG TPA: ISAzo13 family transposase [Roseiflexaceae bacterium]